MSDPTQPPTQDAPAATTLREATRAANEERERYSALIDGLDAVVWEAEADTLRFTFVSRSVERILGWTAEEWLSEPDFWQNRIVHPDDMARAVALFEDASRAGRDHDIEYRARTRNGDPIWLQERVRVLPGVDGRPAILRGVMIDITEHKRTTFALEESREQFRQLAENIDAVFWLYDIDQGRTIYVSPEYEAVWGRPREEVYERLEAWSEGVHPEDRERALAVTRAAGNSEYEVEYRVIRPDGEIRWVLDRGFPVRDESGRVHRVAGVALDVTERKRTEEALRETNQKFDQIAALVPQVFWIFSADFSETIYVSPAYEEVWGRPLAEVNADPTTFLADIHPDDLPRLYEAMGHVGAAPLPGVEYRIVRQDGSVRWVFSRGYPVLDDKGVPYRVVGTTEDITARKAMNAELIAAELKYRRLVENAPYAIYALDAQSRFIEANPAAQQLLGRSAEEIVGHHISEVIAPEDLAKGAESLRAKLEGEADTTDVDLCVLHSSGEKRLVHIRATTIRDDGEIVGSQGIARDITEEAQKERQLRRAERLASVGTLIGGVAHELNNPLTSVISFASLLADGMRTDEEREDLETIRREGMRAAKIVADLRLLARQTQEEVALSDAVDLNDVVAHVLKTRRYVLETRNIEIREDLARNLPCVLGDRVKLEQILLNLVVNAEQAMEGVEAERRLIVRTRPCNVGVTLSVIDTGAGISPEHLERIFDPFFTTKAPAQGTGLGLSLVHRIVEEHGGRIQVESQLGTGTAFRVELPAAGTSDADPHARPENTSAATPLHILVVDDEPTIRSAFSRYLRKRGHIVDTAGEGAEALRMIEQAAPYDVIVTDLRMPGLGGEQLLGRLRELGTGLDRRVVFLTGDAASGEAARILADAAVPVLFKPISLDALATQVETIASDRSPSENGRPA